jgi:hypothetical protein
MTIPDDERAAVAIYHGLVTTLADELETEFGAEIDIPNQENQAAYEKPRFKRIIRVGVEAAETALKQQAFLKSIHDEIMTKFKKKVFRAINVPALYTDVNYASLSVNMATSVSRVDEEHYHYVLKEAESFKSLVSDTKIKRDITQQIKTLSALEPDELRWVKSSGLSYQLYIYTKDGKQRCNLNHAVVLVGDHDIPPEVLLQRPRQQRSDVKKRELAFSFNGGTVLDHNGKERDFEPVYIYKR